MQLVYFSPLCYVISNICWNETMQRWEFKAKLNYFYTNHALLSCCQTLLARLTSLFWIVIVRLHKIWVCAGEIASLIYIYIYIYIYAYCMWGIIVFNMCCSSHTSFAKTEHIFGISIRFQTINYNLWQTKQVINGNSIFCGFPVILEFIVFQIVTIHLRIYAFIPF